MKRLSVVCCALFVSLLAAPISLATPVCGGAQNVLTPGFTCESGGLVFGDFSVINAGQSPSPSMILVTADESEDYVYLNFNPSLAIQSGAADLWFYFQVTGGISGVDLAVGGNNAAITERVCSTPIDENGNICTGGITNQLASINTFSGNSIASYFPDNKVVSRAYVFKNILVQGPGELSSFSQSFHVPEPVSFVLIGSGLLVLGLFRPRARSRA